MVYRVLEQRCREWNIPLYISTIDFTKAFDSIKTFGNMEIAETLRSQTCICEATADCFTANRKEQVLTDKESDVFSIKRGTKQGDPLSSLLFNTVLQYSLRRRPGPMAGEAKKASS